MIIRAVVSGAGGYTIRAHCETCGAQVGLLPIKTKDPPAEMLIGEYRTERCAKCEPPEYVVADAFRAERGGGFGYDHM